MVELFPELVVLLQDKVHVLSEVPQLCFSRRTSGHGDLDDTRCQHHPTKHFLIWFVAWVFV
jgi:hypothetical protein